MTTESLVFSPYRVSTITCNADIGKDINIDLSVLFDNINIKEDEFVWIQHLKDKSEIVRGTNPKKKRKTKTSSNEKNRFDNQITAIYKLSPDYYPNIKIFKNGNIQMTGIRDISHPKIIIDVLIDNIKTIYNSNIKIIITNYNDINPTERLVYSNFKVRMINSDFKVYKDLEMTDRFNIKRKELHNILISHKYQNKSSFQPGVYQGVKLEYYWNENNKEHNGICRCSVNCFGKNSGTGNGNCKKVTVAIFESGSILITGGITFQQIDDAYSYICNIINENKNTIKKNSSDVIMQNLVII